jgi:hypothetical protein
VTVSDRERWLAVLDEIERHTDACERRFLRGEPVDTPAPAAPPPDLGALPHELEARARTALDRLRLVQGKVERVPRPGATVSRTRFSGRPTGAVTLDRTI